MIPVDGKDGPADVCVIELGGTIGNGDLQERLTLINHTCVSNCHV